MVKKNTGWKMAISIAGMFMIPVRLKGVASEAKTDLHEYHRTDMGRGGRLVYCKECNGVLKPDDIIKGLEVAKGQVVTFSAEELAALPLPTTRNIVVDRFVDESEVNPLTYEKAYYLAPDEEYANQAFNLFLEGLKKLSKVAVGKVAISKRESLCVVRPMHDGLVVSTLFWENEMKDAPTVAVTEVPDTQMDLMTTVIQKFTKPFEFGEYSDQYMTALNEMARAKIAGEKIAVEPAAVPVQNIEDALRALAEA